MSRLHHALRRSLNVPGVTTTAIALISFIFLAPRSDAESKPLAIASESLAAGAYFGLKFPGETPERFAPGIINIPDRSVGRIAFSPDATERALTVFEST